MQIQIQICSTIGNPFPNNSVQCMLTLLLNVEALEIDIMKERKSLFVVVVVSFWQDDWFLFITPNCSRVAVEKSVQN